MIILDILWYLCLLTIVWSILASVTMSSTILRAGSTALTPPTACPAKLFTSKSSTGCVTTCYYLPSEHWSQPQKGALFKYLTSKQLLDIQDVSFQVFLELHNLDYFSMLALKYVSTNEVVGGQVAASKMALRISGFSDAEVLRSCCKGTILRI